MTNPAMELCSVLSLPFTTLPPLYTPPASSVNTWEVWNPIQLTPEKFPQNVPETDGRLIE